MKRYTTLITIPFLLLMSVSLYSIADDDDDSSEAMEFECKKTITELSVVYYGDTPVDVVVYNKKKKGSVIQNFSTVEKGDILDVDGLADAKKEILWELYEIGTDNKLGESLFYLKCKDNNVDGPEHCGKMLGNGKKEDDENLYLKSWLFNGLVDKKGNSFRCDLPETHLIAPKITLIGNEQIALEIGDDFIDPGAKADDNLDGDLTALITSKTDLDILTVGDYSVTYTVVDFDGNIATATRIVTVSDEFVKARTVQSRVVASSDDAEQDIDGKVYLESSDLELVEDYSDLQTNSVGLRFSNLNIPQNSVITKSYIQFKVDEASLEDANITIYAEKNKQAPTFYVSAFNLSARTKTDSSVSWTPAPWNNVGSAAAEQRTPDLSAIIQEVVSGSGYVHSMAFILEGQGTRIAESYEGDPEGAPLLFVAYEGGTVVQTMSVSPQIRRMLPVNSLEYELVNAPDKGNVEINSETGDFVYIADAGTTGSDVLKFKTPEAQLGSDALIINITLAPAPVLLNGVELSNFSSNIALLILDTNNQTIPDDPKIKGVLTIIPPGSSGVSSLTSTPEYSDYMEVELRGSSSQTFPKKGYGVDTETFDGENNDVSLLGMPEEHKWVLHGPYSDKSLMRNYIAYTKTREMGGYSAVRSAFVEVLVREGNSYRYDGVYVFMEKIKRDKNRVDVKKLDSDDTTEPDISGGYIMAQDRESEDWFFKTNPRKSTVIMEYPDSDDLNDQQKNYIQGFMNSFETALFDEDFNDSSSDKYYENFIEPDTFAKHLLSRELFSDVDTWMFSEFFQKNRDGKLSMLPVWDFNLGMGNANYRYSGSTSGWHHDGHENGTGGWMNRLMLDSKFKNSVGQTWFALRSGLWSDENLNKFIDETKALLQEPQARNFQRWPVLGIYTWPNRMACEGGTVFCDTWDKEVDDHLRAWLLARAAWMDANLPK